MKKTVVAALAGLILILPGALILTGCSKAQSATLGAAPVSEANATVHDLAGKPAQKVTLTGEMIEKCPVAGCWFVLRDKTGTVRVDTKAAGFVVSSVPLHTTMTVSGTVVAGAQPSLAATGARY